MFSPDVITAPRSFVTGLTTLDNFGGPHAVRIVYVRAGHTGFEETCRERQIVTGDLEVEASEFSLSDHREH